MNFFYIFRPILDNPQNRRGSEQLIGCLVSFAKVAVVKDVL